MRTWDGPRQSYDPMTRTFIRWAKMRNPCPQAGALIDWLFRNRRTGGAPSPSFAL